MLTVSFCVHPSWSIAQSQETEYQSGTIVAVKLHDPAQSDPAAKAYDVTVRIGDREYITLYSSPIGSDRVKFSEGQSLLFKVGPKTIGYRDMLGRYSEWPILSSKEVPQKDRR